MSSRQLVNRLLTNFIRSIFISKFFHIWREIGERLARDWREIGESALFLNNGLFFIKNDELLEEDHKACL